MKLITLLLALSLSYSCFAQPKDASTIIIKHTDIKTVADKILDLGYIIKDYSPELGTITTKPNDFDTYMWTLTVHVRVKDSTAYIKGRFNAAGFDMQVSNNGTKASIPKKAFGRLQEIGQALSNEVIYQ